MNNFRNINTYKINKNKLSKRPIGKIIENINDFQDTRFKNIVISYANNTPILIKTNLNQQQWDLFCTKGMSKQELDKYI